MIKTQEMVTIYDKQSFGLAIFFLFFIKEIFLDLQLFINEGFV
jgi:hypothetical protein